MLLIAAAAYSLVLAAAAPLPRTEVERPVWHRGRVVALYGVVAEADLVTTSICLRKGHGVETNPLPGMQHEYGRQAWATLTVTGLVMLDRHLVTHHHSRWAHAERIAVIVWQAGIVAGNTGALGHRSWLQTLHLAGR